MRTAALLLTLLLLILTAQTSPASAQDPIQAERVIAAINAWRLEEGKWPLQPNDTLQKMAEDQAAYLLTLPALPEGGDIHIGRNGDDPRARARRAPYNWPTYTRPEQITVTEIAYDGRTVSAAMTFWRGSTIHRNAALNEIYREIGVAAMPHDDGYLYIVVLGARPNVLPALVDSQNRLLYLTDERNSYARGPQWIQSATRVRFFDAEGRPLGSGWQPWARMLPLPQSNGDRLFVMLSDGTVDVLTEVDMQEDAALLPQGMVAQLPSPTPASRSTLVATPGPTSTPGTSSTPIAIPGPTVTPGAGATATPTPQPTASGSGDVTLIYDARSLTLYNSTGRAIDVTGLTIEQGALRLSSSQWQTQWLSGTLTEFAARDCLQVSTLGQPEPPPPGECRFLRSAILIPASDRPWLGAPFNVSRNGTRLATCPTAPARCSFSLR